MKMNFAQWALSPAVLAMVLAASPAAQAKLKMPLNDTGANLCLDVSTNQFTPNCTGTGQDGETGRDATKNVARDGRVGFSYQKVCNSGELSGVGACPAKPVLGTGANQWGCTKDLVTGLIWEIKILKGLRSLNNTYTNWGDGRVGDASAFVVAVNSAGLCGANDWRLPTRSELQGIVDYSAAFPAPTIDTAWFPRSTNYWYWTSSVFQGWAWFVHFDFGYVRYDSHFFNLAVRLVRDGQ